MYISEVYGRGGIYAKVVEASEANSVKLWTIETRAPKFIDAEFSKHRMLSSNSSSSRAMPFVDQEKYLPFDLRAKQSGMQGYEYVPYDIGENFKTLVSDIGTMIFEDLSEYESHIHKQHLNRYLEPWAFQKKVVTGTEWDNFFKLRLAKDAQPEVQELARCIKEAMSKVNYIRHLLPGQWHLPYIQNGEIFPVEKADASSFEAVKKCSVARCARVSFMNHDSTNPSVKKDLKLFDFLLKSKHLTPFEHQLTPMRGLDYPDSSDPNKWEPGVSHLDKHYQLWSGNMKGWIQYRKLIE